MINVIKLLMQKKYNKWKFDKQVNSLSEIFALSFIEKYVKVNFKDRCRRDYKVYHINVWLIIYMLYQN